MRSKHKGQVSVGALVVLVLMLAAGCFVGTPTDDDFLVLTDDLPTAPIVPCGYHDTATSADRVMNLSVYRPDSTAFPGPRPAVVYFHGGGWLLDEEHGDLVGVFKPRIGAAIFAQVARGWIVVSADYRLSFQAKFPAAATDAKAAVNCAKDLGDVDVNHVVVAGSSAGGHLATLTGLTAGKWEPGPTASTGLKQGWTLASGGTTVEGVVNLDGPTDLRGLTEGFGGNSANLTEEFGPTFAPGTAEYSTVGARATFNELVPGLLCGTDAQSSNCSATVAAGIDEASPLHYVQGTPSTGAGLRIYLACGDTQSMPAAFWQCNDHLAFFNALDVAYGTPQTDRAMLDSTWDNTTTSHPDGGNHLTIDRALNFKELNKFLDR